MRGSTAGSCRRPSGSGPASTTGSTPTPTGASEMSRSCAIREIWPLDEQDQDAELTRRAIAFAREEPGRVLGLAIVKLGRYWSPWPNAEGLRSLGLAVASARRGDARPRPHARWASGTAAAIPAPGCSSPGRILYFSALHMVFASSMRYRIPGEMPALGLSAIGWASSAGGRVTRQGEASVRASERGVSEARTEPRPPGSTHGRGLTRCGSVGAWRRCVSGAWCSACRSSAAGSGSPIPT